MPYKPTPTRGEQLEDNGLQLFLQTGLGELEPGNRPREALQKMAEELERYGTQNPRNYAFKVFNTYHSFCHLRGFAERLGQPRLQKVAEAYRRLASGKKLNPDLRRVREFVKGLSNYIANGSCFSDDSRRKAVA